MKKMTFRELFTLPPIKESSSTALSVPAMPAQTVTTGDREVDAVLWLQEVVRTGHQGHIDNALVAVRMIKTPMKVLEGRYMDYLRASGAHPLQIAFGTMGFGDLEKQAKHAVIRAKRRHEALARFGSIEAIGKDTPAEQACRKALRGLKRNDTGLYDDEQVRERMSGHPNLVPTTVEDCLYARAYWRDMYWLRSAAMDFGDSSAEGSAHDWYCLAMLTHIQPRNLDEAVSAFDHLRDNDSLDSSDSPSIMRNLIVSGWEAAGTMQRRLTERCAELENALKGLSNMYTYAWDMVGGGLMMMDVKRFELAHKEARRVLGIELMEVDEDGNLWPEHQERTV
jgi:hypothetical protein